MRTNFISDSINTYGINVDLDVISSRQKSKIQQDMFPAISTLHTKKLQLHNRRYIGNKYKLSAWIFSIINKECSGKIFADIFSGTGAIAMKAHNYYDKLIINDFLYSNYAIYQAFFGKGKWSKRKIFTFIDTFNKIQADKIASNYFSKNFGERYFSKDSAKIIGYIRQFIENNKDTFTRKEYYILLASLLYSTDKIANTVGHYDSYLKKNSFRDYFYMYPIDSLEGTKAISIYKQDANLLVKNITTDIVYIDPPYNSRQYSRFYHVLETLTKWDKSELYGVCLKPKPENVSDYCKVSAMARFNELIKNAQTKYIVVSYNNTYNPKSTSSKNKITLDQIDTSLKEIGRTKIFSKNYKYFNTGNTDFKNHKEYLFVTTVSI